MQIATIGYENDSQGQMIERLKAAGVGTVIDIRAVASSRKAGFSKNLLAASLAEHGIAYVHLQKLGTPKPGRDAARAGRIDEMTRIFEAHLEEPAPALALQEAGEIALKSRAALLCYEADACGCHRSIVAARLKAALGLEVADL